MSGETLFTAMADMRLRFKDAGLETPDLDARLLVQAALGVTHEQILLDTKRIVSAPESERLKTFTARRLRHEPVSRILEHRAFWRSDFKISRETLDPRPDSETLIEAVLAYVAETPPKAVLDLGTGTGCLLLSLLQELPGVEGLGIDISADAVATAEENARALGLAGRAAFKATDWAQLEADRRFDIVISNPPYIADAEIETLAPEVRDYDPRRALSGGADGLDCYRDLARLLPGFMTPEGAVFLEIGAGQAKDVKDILAGAGFHVLQVISDIAGHDRCIVAHRGELNF